MSLRQANSYKEGSFIDRPRHTCALGGALFTLRALSRVIPIIHASPGCGYNVYTAFNAGAGYLGGGYCGGAAWPSSNVVENEIVFGGEDRLKEQILSTLELMDGDLYVVVSGCMVEMIGDDLLTVVASIKDSPAPLLAVPTPSFKGNSYDGYDIILEGLFEGLTRRQTRKEKGLLNILGIVPGQDVFYRGNLSELKRLLEALGFKVNSFFGDGEDISSIRRAARAEATILLSDVAGQKAASFLEDARGVPTLKLPFPIGAQETENFLKGVAKALGLRDSKVQKLLSFENRRYYEYLERAADIYNDIDLQRYTVIVADSNYAPSVSNFVSEELGFVPVLTVVTDPLTEEKQKEVLLRFHSSGDLPRPLVRFGTQTSDSARFLREAWAPVSNHRYSFTLSPGLVIGSVYERELAEDYSLPLVTLSFPATNRVVFQEARAGYLGGLTLASEIFTTLVSGR
ncbi:MAG: hypothetical protein LBE38_00510 [Deltaproteobacteria bacterium]|jgi:nitrogenase molybdenum-iron protein beta chain|nr:hypothetical protein [Deltaproteobacteria bacterium]